MAWNKKVGEGRGGEEAVEMAECEAEAMAILRTCSRMRVHNSQGGSSWLKSCLLVSLVLKKKTSGWQSQSQ